jgi:hypothetical protein
VANDAASSMSDLAVTPGTATPPPHRAPGLPVRDTAVGTVITAEIPAVRAGPSYGVLLPDGSVWYPGSRKRLPAPLFLRVAVWVLAFAVLFAAAGDIIVHYHPSWVKPLRHMVTPHAAAASHASSTHHGASPGGGGSSSAVTLMNPQPTGLPGPLTAYTVDQTSYTVTVTSGPEPAWVAAEPYANGQIQTGQLTQRTLQTAGEVFLIPARHGLLVHIGAGGTTIKVYRGFHYLATVPTPPHCPCYVLFEPSHS